MKTSCARARPRSPQFCLPFPAWSPSSTGADTSSPSTRGGWTSRLAKARHEARSFEHAQEIAELLGKTVLRFEVKAGPTGALFGSVTPTDIADEIWRTRKVRVDRRKVATDPIKRIGRYAIPIDLFEGVLVEVKTLVVPEGGGTVGVDIDLADDPARVDDRHDDLGARRGEAGEIARVGVDVVYDLRPARGCGCAADALADRDADVLGRLGPFHGPSTRSSPSTR